MKASIYIFLLIIMGSCKSSSAQSNPQKVFKEHIKVIDLLLKGKTTYDLDKTVVFLEDLTGIKSEINPGFVITYEPTEQNLKDWKSWYKKNKKHLYWDEKENKVKVRM